MQGLSKDKDKPSASSSLEKRGAGANANFSNALWVYSISSNKWSCFYRNEEAEWAAAAVKTEPKPRFAHQIVYDDINRVRTLFSYFY